MLQLAPDRLKSDFVESNSTMDDSFQRLVNRLHALQQWKIKEGKRNEQKQWLFAISRGLH